MNGQQTREALYKLASEREREFEIQLATLDPANKTERKALNALLNFTRNCAGFPCMRYMGNDYTVREDQIRNLHVFDDYLFCLDTLKGDEKESFLMYAASVSMVYSQFYACAKAIVTGTEMSAHDAFEAKLKYDCTREILEKWIAWWNQHGCVKCEVKL